jgi:hypothetical protein
VQNSAYSTQEVMVTIVNHSKLVDIFIEEHPQIFQFPTKSGTVRFIPKDGFINDHLTINFNPSLAGEYSSSVIFDGFDQEIELSARILPEKGNWLIIENFEESLGDFNHNVLQGNPRYGWHHSSWDNDKFARLRGSYDDYEPRECWLISPPLAVNNISQFFLNFRTARNDNKSPDQLQVYLASNLPIDGIPADAVKLNPQLSEGNYDWKNSSWLILSKSQLPKADSLYLLFRYYFNGNTHGQETWELDNIKFYGAY